MAMALLRCAFVPVASYPSIRSLRQGGRCLAAGEKGVVRPVCRCRHCGRLMPTRNALFRHLQVEDHCRELMCQEDPAGASAVLRSAPWCTVALLVSYAAGGHAAARRLALRCLKATGDGATLQMSQAGDALLRRQLLADCGQEQVLSSSGGALADVLSARVPVHIPLPRAGAVSADVQILGASLAPSNFEAEADCTRRDYCYLLPLWALCPEVSGQRSEHRRGALRRLKALLRRAGAKLREGSWSWQSFADGDLTELQRRGKGVSSHISSLKASEVSLSWGPCVLIDISGDYFLGGQCQRLVSLLLAIFHGWLPEETLETALREELELVKAPEEFLFLRRCGFAELSRRNEQLLEDVKVIEADVLERVCAAPELARRWLPQLKCWAQTFRTVGTGAHLPAATCRLPAAPAAAPEEYGEVLALLRRLARGGWPKPSRARARLLKGEGGSFSLGFVGSGQALPGNEAFPELLGPVFALERRLRPTRSSAVAAVNCNAAFAPHRDGGLGHQSTSLIVGLGDYTGGELCVDGVVADIRYQPLDFHGGRQKHWTLPFQGERFSIVWFTPGSD
ncbi:unnamed protein product [Effrenium voratum]|nr:unnamed protein product [Effrenium voratum]